VKLYIWEGNGISNAYHDDGLLVVLAESPEDAREHIASERRRYAAANRRARPKLVAIQHELNAFARENGGFRGETWKLPGARVLLAKRDAATPRNPGLPDGDQAALDREPDQVIELTQTTIVAFNGGGYD
jgi:hypothetical protein